MKLLLTALAPVALMGAASAQQGLMPLPQGTTVAQVGPGAQVSTFPSVRATTGCDDFDRTTGLGSDWGPLMGTPGILNNAFSCGATFSRAQYLPASVSYDAAEVTIDLPDNPQIPKGGAVLIGLGGAENLFIELQCTTAGTGVYDAILFFTGMGYDTSATTGWGGPFGLVTPITGGTVTVYTDAAGDLLYVDLDVDRDGIVDQALIAPNASLTANGSLLTSFGTGIFGTEIGVGGFSIGTPSEDLDDFELNGGCVPQGPSLSILGSCPGPIGVDISGMTPNTQLALVVGASGSFAIPANRACPGTQLNLNPLLIPNGPRYFVLAADANGDLNIPVLANAPNAACGFAQLVALDLTVCAVTNVASL